MEAVPGVAAGPFEAQPAPPADCSLPQPDPVGGTVSNRETALPGTRPEAHVQRQGERVRRHPGRIRRQFGHRHTFRRLGRMRHG